MSLPILVAIVVVGIALTVAAVHFTGGSKVSIVADTEHARQLFFADHPDAQPGKVEITVDRRSAFLELPDKRIGIIQSFGDGFFTRIVSRSDIAQIKLREPATLSIRFRDFSWTGGHFTFSASSIARSLHAALDPAAKA
ncbi:MAG: hypothetical protein AB7P20_22390 [Rhizobiaceae bacterium]